MEQETFTRLMKDHEALVFKIVSRYCGNGDDARDIAASVWTKTYASASSVRQEEDFPRWLAAVTRNCCIDYLRARRFTVPVEIIEEAKASTEPAALDRLSNRQDTGLLQEALRSLPEEDRLIIVLHHLKGESVRALSARLDISVSSAKVRLYRAREKLRDILVKQGVV